MVLKSSLVGVAANDYIQEIRFKSISRGAAQGFWMGLGTGIVVGPIIAFASEKPDEDPAPDAVVGAAGMVVFGGCGALCGAGAGGLIKSKDIYRFGPLTAAIIRSIKKDEFIEEDRQCREYIQSYQPDQEIGVYLKTGSVLSVQGLRIGSDSTSWHSVMGYDNVKAGLPDQVPVMKVSNRDIQQILVQRRSIGIFKAWTWTGTIVGLLVSALPFDFDKTAFFAGFAGAGCLIDMLKLSNWKTFEVFQFYTNMNQTFICNFDDRL